MWKDLVFKTPADGPVYNRPCKEEILETNLDETLERLCKECKAFNEKIHFAIETCGAIEFRNSNFEDYSSYLSSTNNDTVKVSTPFIDEVDVEEILID